MWGIIQLPLMLLISTTVEEVEHKYEGTVDSLQEKHLSPTGTYRNCFFFFQVLSADMQLDCPLLSSPTGLLPMVLALAQAVRCCWQVPVKLGYSLLLLIKSVSQVSLLM